MDAPRWIRRGLLACYSFEMTALAVWIGGLVVIIGAVIPAVFNSFTMEPGGRFLTRVFDGYNRLVIAAIVVLVGSSAVRLWIDMRYHVAHRAVMRPEIILLAVMIVLAGGIMLVLGPWSVALQEQAFALKEETAKKAAYAAFFKTHMAVRGLYLVNLVIGLTLVTVKLKAYLQSWKLIA